MKFIRGGKKKMKRLISVITVWLILGLGVWLLEAKEGVTTQIKTKKEDVSTRSSSKNLPPLQKKPPFKVGDVVGYSEPGLPERYIGKVVVATKWGSGPGEVNLIDYHGPVSFCVDKGGNIYILDRKRLQNPKYGWYRDWRIQKFSSEGGYLKTMSINIQGIKDLCVDNAGNIYLYFGIGPNEEIPKTIKEGWINKYSAEGELLDTFTIPDISLVDMEVPGGRIKFIDIEKRKAKIIFLPDRKTPQLYRYCPVDIQDKSGFEVLDEKGKVIRQVIVSLLPQTIIESERQGHILEPYIGGMEVANIDEEDNIYIEVRIYYQTCIEVLASEDDDPEKVKIDKKTGKPMKIGKMITTGLSYFYKYDKTGENLLAILNQGVPGAVKDVFIDAYGEAHIPSYYKNICWDRKGNFYQLLLRKSGAYIIKRSKNIGVKPRM